MLMTWIDTIVRCCTLACQHNFAWQINRPVQVLKRSVACMAKCLPVVMASCKPYDTEQRLDLNHYMRTATPEICVTAVNVPVGRSTSACSGPTRPQHGPALAPGHGNYALLLRSNVGTTCMSGLSTTGYAQAPERSGSTGEWITGEWIALLTGTAALEFDERPRYLGRSRPERGGVHCKCVR